MNNDQDYRITGNRGTAGRATGNRLGQAKKLWQKGQAPRSVKQAKSTQDLIIIAGNYKDSLDTATAVIANRYFGVGRGGASIANLAGRKNPVHLVNSTPEFQKLLNGKNIRTLVIGVHGTDGRIGFNTTEDYYLSGIVTYLKKEKTKATVNRIVFISCKVGHNPLGMLRFGQVFNAAYVEASNVSVGAGLANLADSRKPGIKRYVLKRDNKDALVGAFSTSRFPNLLRLRRILKAGIANGKIDPNHLMTVPQLFKRTVVLIKRDVERRKARSPKKAAWVVVKLR